MDIRDLGNFIKQKYPQYIDLSAKTLGQLVLSKYPQYKDIIPQLPQVSQAAGTIGERFQQLLSQSLSKEKPVLPRSTKNI